MKEENFGLTMLLAKKAGLFGKVFVSTSSLAVLTGFSQQSISRKLRELENEKVISRKVSNSGIEISFTENGRKELESFYFELRELFSRKKFSLKAKVVEGLGEGTYYTSIPQYKKQFSEKFGFDLFPGTLNLEVDPSERNVFTSSEPVKVNGFETKSRTFGGIDCWPCFINKKVKAIAIIPHRTNHPDNVLELIAPFSLRKKLNLKSNSFIEVVKE
ncbi:CTP-dependent riboflavin kinase [archaeon]|nr:CTP-dependent riboflavin kinase [archaeon]